jgi:uncharacterized protein YndB with AHSA1/START domain
MRIAASPATVWRFLVEPARLAEWWGVATVEARAGGRFRVEMSEGPRPVMRGEIVELVVPERLVLTFGWEDTPGAPDLGPGASMLTITLRPDGRGTELRLRHEDLPPSLVDETDAGWMDYLGRLRAACARAASG